MKHIVLTITLLSPINLIAQEVSEQEISDLVNIFAHPALEGRGTSQPGSDLAAELIKMKLKEYGMHPLHQLENSYFHDFSFKQVVKSEESELRILGVKDYEYGEDFLLIDPSQKVVEGTVAFVGFGINAPEYEYNDYSGINVRGKIVVMFRHEPYENVSNTDYFKGNKVTIHSHLNKKIDTARENGAAGVIIVQDVLNHIGSYGPIDIPSPVMGVVNPIQGRQSSSLPVISVSMATANEILGMDIMDLQQEIEKDRSPYSFLRNNVTLRITTKEKVIEHKSRNVLARFIGKEHDEFILIGAHYDHLGAQKDGVYLGADDNASGVAGVLAVAKALSEGDRMRRSIIIAFWGAEEWGMIGSQMFIADVIIPIQHIKAVINLDMIGRDDPSKLIAIGAEDNSMFEEKSPQIYSMLIEENNLLANPFNLDFTDGANLFYRTDSASFFLYSPPMKRMPVLFLTGGDHPDYHRTTDTVDKLDTGKIRNISQIAYNILVRLADEKELPEYKE